MLKHSVMLLFLSLYTISLQMDHYSIFLHFITYGLLLYSAVSALFHSVTSGSLLHFAVSAPFPKNCLWCSIPQSLGTISLHLGHCSILVCLHHLFLHWLYYKSVSSTTHKQLTKKTTTKNTHTTISSQLFLLLHCIVSTPFPQNVFNAQFHYIWVVVALHHPQKTVFTTVSLCLGRTLFFSVPKNLLTTVFVVSCVRVHHFTTSGLLSHSVEILQHFHKSVLLLHFLSVFNQ